MKMKWRMEGGPLQTEEEHIRTVSGLVTQWLPYATTMATEQVRRVKDAVMMVMAL